MSGAAVAGDGGGRKHDGKGRLAGRSPAEVVKSAAEAGLPAELGAAVLAVTGKTRLWKGERTDVARELCGHLLDGVAAGEDANELLATFGEPVRAARLITRAKKRNRPWACRAMKRTVQAAGLLLSLSVAWYGWNAARYYSGSPTIRFNVQAEMNAAALAVPLKDRAWPHYRDAARGLMTSGFNKEMNAFESWPNTKPGSADWAGVCALTDRVRTSVDLIRRGASMDRAAYVINQDMATKVFDYVKHPELVVPEGVTADPGENPVALAVLLPQLGNYRQLARVLSFEVRRAAYEGRADAAVEDTVRMLRLAHHASEDGTLIGQYVDMAIAHLALRTVAEVTQECGDALSEAHLQRLAHALGAYAPGHGSAAGSWSPDLRYERRRFSDLLQRFYTDDGNGDGRLCAGPADFASRFGVKASKSDAYFQPVIAGLVAGRAELQEVHTRLFDRFELEIAKPLYQRDQTALDREVENLKGKLGVRNSLAVLLAPPDVRTVRGFDELRMYRDAVAGGIAAELYARRTGSTARGWSDLVPSLLPSAPVDPWSGRELVFKPGAVDAGSGKSERPLIYSVGGDGIDDGGKMGSPGDPARVQMARKAGTAPPTWDWVLWPKTDSNAVMPMAPTKGSPIESKDIYEWGWVGSLARPAVGRG